MGKFFLTISILTLFVPAPLYAALFRDMSLGAYGEDVRELQILLNREIETKVADSGPGSPGQETLYFGPLTEDAVRRFQARYATEILYPLGLTMPTGFVGAATRNMFLSNGTPSEIERIVTNIDPYAETNVTENTQNTDETIKALEDELTSLFPANAELILSAIDDAGTAQGFSQSEITAAREAVEDVIAHFDDEDIENFIEDAKNAEIISTNESLLDAIEDIEQDLERRGVTALGTFLAGLFGIPVAHAQFGALNPFGGFIGTALPCTCTGGTVWQVVVVGPKGGLFNYVVGTQMYLNYNLPLQSINTLGLYTPAGAALCIMGVPPACSPTPALGAITPITGSSLTGF